MATSTWLLLCCLMLTCYVQDSIQLRLKNIIVPPLLKDDVESVILDCDYDFEDTSHDGLVVKWYKDNGNLLVYQWILHSEPRVTDEFENYVDVNYTASDDPLTMYRALKFVRPGVELTGTYKCVISVYEGEVEGISKMVIYSTEDKFDLILSEKNQTNKDRLEAMCMAEGLYPKPTLDISIGQLENLNANVRFAKMEDHKFNVYSHVTVDKKDLPESAIIKCTLGIPDANYTVFRETVYYSGSSAHSLSTSLIFLMGQLLIFAASIL
ncbi:uncharacterized protein LOC107274004 isoform X2 [Cephus cinctus]|uniref:Uncharacterized protein LOC107274004 isoform X2 n=1 Tax=Cephus cinctus TaxID=211228 RepID=A0AAJ7CES5_CEPCN|nr:uncharacterized protein LOC107274004 isoform X2 [Cephus cinctus]